jgi:2-amino-4-hydroxy-6-hydroxymethyldihydropteridine diphosphokinase
LTVPHPGLAERAFVLIPLADIAEPGLTIPGFGTLRQLLANIDEKAVVRVAI